LEPSWRGLTGLSLDISSPAKQQPDIIAGGASTPAAVPRADGAARRKDTAGSKEVEAAAATLLAELQAVERERDRILKKLRSLEQR